MTFPTQGSITDLEEMDLKQKLEKLRANKEWKCQVHKDPSRCV